MTPDQTHTMKSRSGDRLRQVAVREPRMPRFARSPNRRYEHSTPRSGCDPRSWLIENHEGRLGYQTGRGQRSVVVLFAVSDDQILLRLPDYNDIVHYAPGERVTLEVDGPQTSPDHPVTVCVTGTAQLLDADQLPIPSEDLFEESWPPGIATYVIGLPMEFVRLVEVS